jgi:signal transduction histidine kinase
MSKSEPLHKRFEDLFSETELPDLDPGDGEQIPEDLAESKWNLNPSETLSAAPVDPMESPAKTQARMGWQDFLNAIDRNEKIGFTFDQEETQPLGQSEPGVGSESVDIPLEIGNEILGSLKLDGFEHLDQADMSLLTSIAEQVSQHVENLRLLEQAERYRAEAEEVTRRITYEGWDAYLNTQDSSTQGYVYDLNRVMPVESATDLVEMDRAIVVRDLKVRDASIGKLAVADPQRDPDSSASLLNTIAERLSVHIENLRLLDETERSRQQLDKRAAEMETVAQVSTAAATILNPEALLQSVVDLTRYRFNLYHSAIYLVNESGDALELAAAPGKIGQILLAEGQTIRLNQKPSAIAKSARTRDVVIIADSEVDPDFMVEELLPDTRSEMAIPMIVAEQLIGVLDVKADIPNRFREDDRQTYTTLATQTAVALRNAQLYAEQMATVERLRELDNMKSAFLANMSHELRTPLNSILGFTQVMVEGLDGPITEDMQMDLELIEKNGKHLLNLINDVLDMARIEAGRVSFYIEPVNIRVLLEDVLRTNSALAREKSLLLNLQSSLQEDQMIMADSVRMRQVLINVIGNSIKFTEQGSVIVHAEQDGDFIHIRVVDTGIGIPPDKLEAIFEAFTQVDTSTTRKVGGTGLGLPISRRLVEMHDGRLWAESTGIEGEGSIFFIELPIEGPESSSDEDESLVL